MVVDVGELCFVVAGVEVEHGVVKDVWPNLKEAPKVLWAERGEHAAVDPSVAITGQETGLWVEVRGDLRVSEG